MASWMYCVSVSWTGVTTTSQNRARSCKTVRGPPKVRLGTPAIISRHVPSHRTRASFNWGLETVFASLSNRFFKNFRLWFFQIKFFFNGNPIQNRWPDPHLAVIRSQISTTRKFSVYCFESDAKTVSRHQLKLALVLWLGTCPEMIAGCPRALLAGLARFCTTSRDFDWSSWRQSRNRIPQVQNTSSLPYIHNIILCKV